LKRLLAIAPDLFDFVDEFGWHGFHHFLHERKFTLFTVSAIDPHTPDNHPVTGTIRQFFVVDHWRFLALVSRILSPQSARCPPGGERLWFSHAFRKLTRRHGDGFG
jgi:hypothetical protein